MALTMVHMDKVEIPVSFLTSLLNCQREYYILCDEFKIPTERRDEKGTGSLMIERIHTYLTAYIMRRSLVERETGAAFPPTEPLNVADPKLDLDKTPTE